jgi:hypothetical protein
VLKTLIVNAMSGHYALSEVGIYNISITISVSDSLCGLVIRVPG